MSVLGYELEGKTILDTIKEHIEMMCKWLDDDPFKVTNYL